MPASRRVTRAVSEVLDLAPRRGEVSLPRLVDAVSEDRERPIELKMADLPPGVCGQWRQYGDRDVFLIQKGLPAWDRTLAHELGHLVLGHQGIPVVQAPPTVTISGTPASGNNLENRSVSFRQFNSSSPTWLLRSMPRAC